MINANDIVENIVKRRKKQLESRVIDEEENKKRLENYKRSNSKPIKSDNIDFSSLILELKKVPISQKVSSSNFDIECEKYYNLMKQYGFNDQGKMNNHISKNKLWSDFPSIRAKNTHGSIENIKGITPKAYARVCELMGRAISTNGRPLVDSKRY